MSFPITNNKGDDRYYGKVFPAILVVQQNFLTLLRKNVATSPTPVRVLEIGAGVGSVTWMIALTGVSEVYANELSQPMLEQFDTVIKGRIPPDVIKKITKVPGSCFDLVKKPELRERFDMIYVQCVDHFFNPVEHQKFLQDLVWLLKENGRVCLIPFIKNNLHILMDPPDFAEG